MTSSSPSLIPDIVRWKSYRTHIDDMNLNPDHEQTGANSFVFGFPTANLNPYHEQTGANRFVFGSTTTKLSAHHEQKGGNSFMFCVPNDQLESQIKGSGAWRGLHTSYLRSLYPSRFSIWTCLPCQLRLYPRLPSLYPCYLSVWPCQLPRTALFTRPFWVNFELILSVKYVIFVEDTSSINVLHM